MDKLSTAAKIIGSVTGLLVAIVGLLQLLGPFDFFARGDENLTGVDRNFVTLYKVNVWKKADVTLDPIALIEPGTVIHVRAKVEEENLFLIDYEESQKGYAVADSFQLETEYVARLKSDIEAEETRPPSTADETGPPSIETPTTIAELRVTRRKITAADWFPRGTRIRASWNQRARIFEQPNLEAKIIGNLLPGKRLSRSTFSAGEVTLVRKMDDGAWYKIARKDRSFGYVVGDSVSEVWPQAKPDGKSLPLVATFDVANDQSTRLYDAKTHYQMWSSGQCAYAVCDRISIYSGTPKNPDLDIRIYQTDIYHGKWTEGELIKIYALVPKKITQIRGANILACIGTAKSCKPILIFENEET